MIYTLKLLKRQELMDTFAYIGSIGSTGITTI